MKKFTFVFGVLFGVHALAQAPTTTSPTTPTLNIACVTDAGGIANANAADVCKAILPKCTDVKAQIIQKVKDQLSLKIW
jgi:hypothetical protein